MSLRRPSETGLARLARDQSGKPLTYPGPGLTLETRAPPGYRLEQYERPIGNGNDFSRARAQLRAWRAHRGSGIAVYADNAIAEGTTVALAAPLPIGYALAACRIVTVVDDDDRYGFAYGTLPIHPESGEELFMIERRDGKVVFRITAFSRPHQFIARIGTPVARWLQSRATERYLTAMSST